MRITPPMQIEGLEHSFWQKQRAFNTLQATNASDRGQSTDTDDTTYQGNQYGNWRNVTAPAVANTEFAIPHNLGRVPTWYDYNIDRAGILYQLPDTLTPWTTTNIYLKCSVASAKLRIFIS